MVLDEVFIEKCRQAFATFDADGSGTIDRDEMKLLLEGQSEGVGPGGAKDGWDGDACALQR